MPVAELPPVFKKRTMITIHKYEFELGPEIEIEMPEFSKIISVQLLNEKPVMWAIVDTHRPLVKRKFTAVWTGEELNAFYSMRHHIATIQDIHVWHIFE
jgi:hypothetical protein